MPHKTKMIYPSVNDVFKYKAKCGATVRAETKELLQKAAFRHDTEATIGNIIDAMAAPLMLDADYADTFIDTLDGMLDRIYSDYRTSRKSESLRNQYVTLWEMRDVLAQNFGKSIKRDPQIALQ